MSPPGARPLDRVDLEYTIQAEGAALALPGEILRKIRLQVRHYC